MCCAEQMLLYNDVRIYLIMFFSSKISLFLVLRTDNITLSMQVFKLIFYFCLDITYHFQPLSVGNHKKCSFRENKARPNRQNKLVKKILQKTHFLSQFNLWKKLEKKTHLHTEIVVIQNPNESNESAVSLYHFVAFFFFFWGTISFLLDKLKSLPIYGD